MPKSTARPTRTKAEQRTTRRQEYAQATQQAIVDAARSLFAQRGYFATKVEDIALAARVSPATVYAVAGGKQGLLHTLMETWTTDPIVASTLERISTMRDPVEVIRLTAASVREMRERFADVMRVMITTAPHDRGVAQQLDTATTRYRKAFLPIGRRLHDLDALFPGTTPEHVVDVLWFYFGYSSYFTLHDDNGWSYDKAEQWLAHEACRALLRPPAESKRRSSRHCEDT
jgi:AcrR family transcriptional regulator